MIKLIDINIFYAINHWPHGLGLDLVAKCVYYLTWGSLVYFGAALILLLFKPARYFCLMLIISLLLTIGFGDLIIKPLVNRPRPFTTLTQVVMVSPVPLSPSFPSSQTATAFALATIISFNQKKKIYVLAWGWAILVGVSRIYMGHHYFSDVLAGAVLGILIARVVWAVLQKSKYNTKI